MHLKPRRLVPALVIALSAAGTAPALAQSPAAPAPECAGITAKDGTGDNHLFGQSAAPTGPTNTDTTQLYFRVIPGDGGKKLLAVDVNVADLSKTPIPGTTSTRWTTTMIIDDVTHRAVAEMSATGAVSFFYTTPNVVGGALNVPTNNPTTGQFIEGANGVVEVHVPLDVVPLGKKLTGLYVETRGIVLASPAGTVGPLVDRMPDSGEAKAYTVAECAVAAPPETSGAPSAPVAEQPPAGSPAAPQQSESSTGQSSTTPTQSSSAPSKSSDATKKKAYKKCVAKAKKLKNKKKRAAALKRCKKKR